MFRSKLELNKFTTQTRESGFKTKVMTGHTPPTKKAKREAETVPVLVPDIFLDVAGTVGGTFTDSSLSSERTEQQLPN